MKKCFLKLLMILMIIRYKNDKNQIIKKIPNYPILIGNKIDLDYYSDIYRYLYVNKIKLDISLYPETIKKKIKG